MKQTNERLCALAQKGDAAALDSLIENNKSFIGKVANDLFRSMNLAQAGLNLDTDDLKQAGNLGLWKACLLYTSIIVCILDFCTPYEPYRLFEVRTQFFRCVRSNQVRIVRTCRGEAPPSCWRKTVRSLKSPTGAFIASQT